VTDDNWHFTGLTPGAYSVMMADPPWAFKLRSEVNLEKSAQGQYRCMSLDDIKALPVADLAAPDCLLWMWATNPMLPQALETMAAWGFTFKTAGHWAKTTKHGKQAFGTGYILRCAGEPFLIGTRGKIKTARNVRSVVMGPVREHSRKPEEAYHAIESLVRDARRADLFSRQTRIGWDSWGDQADLFDSHRPLLSVDQ
jgi:N6-adenosine-specific RNA methylase IME4